MFSKPSICSSCPPLIVVLVLSQTALGCHRDWVPQDKAHKTSNAEPKDQGSW